jgi:Domain of unknown function (DUF4390)
MTSVAPLPPGKDPVAVRPADPPAGGVTRRACGLQALRMTVLVLAAGSGLGMPPVPARAAESELSAFELLHNEEGLLLTYAVDIDLSRSVDDALSKAVPLFFVANAEVFRERWYWRDQRVARAVRVWRIVFQPLTATYRVTFAGHSQNYGSREEAFAAISRGSRWKIAEPSQLDEGAHQYIEFSYRLDTSLLPRPMQIGLGGQADWAIAVQRKQRIN